MIPHAPAPVGVTPLALKQVLRYLTRMDKKIDLLKKYFGHEEFREGQGVLVDCVLSGRDCLGIMPTGAGKSVCYQLPGVMADGITLVVSPLISLMKDQVDALCENGISAAYINSSLTFKQIDRVLDLAKGGKYKIIYIAPERLDMDSFISFAQAVDIYMVTVDEAHCVSQWGQDFRPSYRKIAEFIAKLPRRPIVSAFTATATDKVRDDIVGLLGLQKPEIVLTGFNRPNLHFAVEKPKDKYSALEKFAGANRDKSGIVYCATRDTVEQVCEKLCASGHTATRYHAGLSDAERVQNQNDFLYDKKTIMVATNAFGMGIDKSNVSYVVHFNMPKNLESYYQEAGRAGRDGTQAQCILMFGAKDVVTNQYFIENNASDLPPEIVQEIKHRDRERLKQMTNYCHTTACLREYILKYFGDKSQPTCDNCGNCTKEHQIVDITEHAQKVLSCIARMNEKFGVKLVIDTLRGSHSQKVISFGLDKIKTYGALHDLSEKRVRDIINFLVVENYIATTASEFPVARLGEQARGVLYEGKRVEMPVAKDYETQVKEFEATAGARQSRRSDKSYDVDPRIFAKLKDLRAKLAARQRMPAYIIFSDATLVDMCKKLPTTQSQLLDVSGVGQHKLEKYGHAFLELIIAFIAEHGIPVNENNSARSAQTTFTLIDNPELLNYVTDKYHATDENSTLSMMADRLLALIAEKYSTPLKQKHLRDKIKSFLISKDLIEVKSIDNKSNIVPTQHGRENGVISESRIGQQGTGYEITLYTPQVQKLVAENILAVLAG